MKRTQYSTVELRERSDEELVSMERQLFEDLFKLRQGKATNQMENTAKLRLVRHDLARVKTVIRARHLGLEAARPDQRGAKS